MNKLDRYRKIMSILNVLEKHDKDFKAIKENLLRQYHEIGKQMKDLLEEKFNNANDYDSRCYYKCYLEKLR